MTRHHHRISVLPTALLLALLLSLSACGLGDSGRQLQQMAGTGNWLEGKRFPSNVSESTVQQWVQSLNL